MPALTRSTIVIAPARDVFALITNPQQVSAFIPGVVEVSEVTLPLQRGSSFRWEFVLLGIRFHGTWIVDELQAPAHYLATTRGGIVSRWAYTLKDEGSTTRVMLEIDFSAPSSLLKSFAVSLIEPHAEKLLETFLDGLKHGLEQQRSL